MKRKLADDPETLILAITTGQGRYVIRKLYEHVLDVRRVLCIFLKNRTARSSDAIIGRTAGDSRAHLIYTEFPPCACHESKSLEGCE